METYKLTGGARIGIVNASWPLAALRVSKDKMELNVSIVGNLAFEPKDIISIEPYSIIPVLGQGIKINHRLPNYNKKIIFWTYTKPAVVIEKIRQTGFLDNIDSNISAADALILQGQSNGIPVKTPVLVGILTLWNLLFLSDIVKFLTAESPAFPLGNGAIAAFALLLIASVLTLTSTSFSKLVLKEGANDMRAFLYLLIGVCSVILLSLLMFKGVAPMHHK